MNNKYRALAVIVMIGIVFLGGAASGFPKDTLFQLLQVVGIMGALIISILSLKAAFESRKTQSLLSVMNWLQTEDLQKVRKAISDASIPESNSKEWYGQPELETIQDRWKERDIAFKACSTYNVIGSLVRTKVLELNAIKSCLEGEISHAYEVLKKYIKHIRDKEMEDFRRKMKELGKVSLLVRLLNATSLWWHQISRSEGIAYADFEMLARKILS